VRLAAAHGLDSPAAAAVAPALLKKALADKDDLVAVTAGASLFRLGDASGVSRILAILRSSDPTANRLAQHAIMKDLTRWGGGTPADEIYRSGRMPLFRVGKAEAEVLATLMKLKDWNLHRAVIYCLAFSEDRCAIEPLRQATRDGENGRNLCRVIGALRCLRARESVPELIGVLGRLEHNEEIGNESSACAAHALAHIAAPEAVEPLIGLLDAKEAEVRDLAEETLSRMFDAKLDPATRLAPPGTRLQPMRKDSLPAPAALRADWESFWKKARNGYEWDSSAPPLRMKVAPPGKI
jgi:HEAT repeat protein